MATVGMMREGAAGRAQGSRHLQGKAIMHTQICKKKQNCPNLLSQSATLFVNRRAPPAQISTHKTFRLFVCLFPDIRSYKTETD